MELPRWLERGRVIGRRALERLWRTARNPRRVLPALVVVALLALSIPLTITGLSRLGRGAVAWERASSISWRAATATVREVRVDDGLVARVTYRDRSGVRHDATTAPADTGRRWVAHLVPVRYDAGDFDRVELVGFGADRPWVRLLIAGAPLGVGIAGTVLATGLWRRRRLVAVSARPLQALSGSLVAAGAIVAVGIAAWAVGTVWQRGWSAVASSSAHLVSTVFGDLLGVLVPLVAFALGCLVTAWLARHRHHDEHRGPLSRAHRLIDRASEMVPSPEELRPQDTSQPDGVVGSR